MKNILLIITAGILITSCGEPMTLDENIDAAHKQYQKAQVEHAGNRSSYLPRVGKIKADDYKNCISQRYYRWEDSYDFCAWHAEIGSKWNYNG